VGSRIGRRAGLAAAAWAIAFAIPSFYWAAGGTAGLETVAATPDQAPYADQPAALAAVGVLKLLGAGLAIALASVRPTARGRRALLAAGWIGGALLVIYGGASLIQHLLMEAGEVAISDSLDANAVRWHVLLWDPWWVLGGALFIVAAHEALRRG
jgi:Protein of unknown function (DUF3995)